jgi:hypothetical protein
MTSESGNSVFSARSVAKILDRRVFPVCGNDLRRRRAGTSAYILPSWRRYDFHWVWNRPSTRGDAAEAGPRENCIVAMPPSMNLAHQKTAGIGPLSTNGIGCRNRRLHHIAASEDSFSRLDGKCESVFSRGKRTDPLSVEGAGRRIQEIHVQKNVLSFVPETKIRSLAGVK